jgi:hypothetical protein
MAQGAFDILGFQSLNIRKSFHLLTILAINMNGDRVGSLCYNDRDMLITKGA